LTTQGISFANNVGFIITIYSDNMPEMRPLIDERDMIAANREVGQGGRNTRTISTRINI